VGDLGQRSAAHVAQNERRALLSRQVLQSDDDREADILLKHEQVLGRGPQRIDRPLRLVERIDELGQASAHLHLSQVVKAQATRQLQEPTGSVLGRGLIGPLDRPRDGFLAKVVRLRAVARHAVAQRPQPSPVLLDGSKDIGRHSASVVHAEAF